MKKQLLILIILLFGGAFHGNTQFILHETFDNGIPNTWTVVNNDGLTPHASVNWCNDAWVSIPSTWGPVWDVAGIPSTNQIASTSWYEPAGTSDDWIISPAINLTGQTVLSWYACVANANWPDGYEVRISTTGTALSDFLANPAIFSTLGENASWTNRTIDLDAAGYANQTVYIAWRNNSTHQEVLALNEIAVIDATNPLYDVIASPVTLDYATIPFAQAGIMNTVNGNLRAGIFNDITNASLTLDVLDPQSNSIYNSTSPSIPAMAAGSSTIETYSGIPTPLAAGVYTYNFSAAMNETDFNTTNDSTQSSVEIVDSVYARDNGVQTSWLGTYGQEEEWINLYEIGTTDSLTSVTFFTINQNGNASTGMPFFVSVYAFDTITNSPGNLIYQTDTIIHDNTANNWLTVGLPTPLELIPGKYCIGLKQNSGNLNLGLASANFTTNAFFYRNITQNGGWASQPFVYMIRANFGTHCYPWAVNTTVNSFQDVNNNISLTAELNNATYQWVDCNNGNSPIIGETNQSFSVQNNGSYAVIVTDNKGCSSTSACQTIDIIGLEENDLLNSIVLAPNPAIDQVMLHNISALSEGSLSVRNALGQELQSLNFSNNSTLNISMPYPSGVYFIELNHNNRSKVFKVILEDF